jgi:hypothetical protein
MKNYFLLALLLISFSLTSQTIATTADGREVTLNDDGTYKWMDQTESEVTEVASNEDYFVGKHIDEMTDKVYYYSSKSLIAQDKAKGQGFRINYGIDGKNDESIKINSLTAKVVGFDCVEKSELLFLFEDGSKEKITSWNKFNCDGNAWFQLTGGQKKSLATKKINKIRYQNGRNFKSYTTELLPEEKDYFIQMHNSVESKNVVAKQFE